LYVRRGIGEKACHEQAVIMDELCVWTERLRAITGTVRFAIEQNNLDSLKASKEDFDQTREHIFELARRFCHIPR
jgi:hypothetical protein